MIPIESDYRRMLVEEDRHREAASYRRCAEPEGERGDGRSRRSLTAHLRRFGPTWPAAFRRDAWHHT